MASLIAYEDVRLAANQLSQCASNVLTVSSANRSNCVFTPIQAINGPLQERTGTLDLDDQRANALPDDYDTDLESEWANESTLRVR